MISLSNETAQTLAPGQALVFDAVNLHLGCNECHRSRSSAIELRNPGVYEISFSGNIGSATAGTAVQLSINIGTSTLPESIMISTSAAANDLNNVSKTIPVNTGCTKCGNGITVVNSGTTDVIVGANASLMAHKVD